MSDRALSPDAGVGERLRRLRMDRGMTQEELAALAGVSVDLIKKLEQGRRQSARLTSLARLTDALDVPLSQLTDKRPHLGRDSDALLLGLRDTLLTPAVLRGFDRDDDGAPTPLPDLEAMLRRAWNDYWNGRLIELAGTLPGLVGEARVAHRGLGGAAGGVLAQAYQACAYLLVHLGHDDLAVLGAERAIDVAADGGDELQWATLYGAYAWALMSQARYAEAERVAIRAAERIEPRFSAASQEHLTVWGGLVLSAMAATVETAPARAMEYLSLSRVGAARIPVDRHDYQVNFGPTQVAMQATYAHAVAGQPDRALSAARGVRREDLRTISFCRHLLDVAHAHAEAGERGRALAVLNQARRLSPVWFRHQVPARLVVGAIAERESRPSEALRDLLQSLDFDQRGGGL
jgi:transcriptional regulator with XRE-family HTH domain